jgi:hypothetical protein
MAKMKPLRLEQLIGCPTILDGYRLLHAPIPQLTTRLTDPAPVVSHQ